MVHFLTGTVYSWIFLQCLNISQGSNTGLSDFKRPSTPRTDAPRGHEPAERPAHRFSDPGEYEDTSSLIIYPQWSLS